jgi:integrase
MRATKLNKLSQLHVRNAPASGPGSVRSDGGGLYLRARLFVFRFTSPVTGKERDLSLGPVDALTLKTAREIAAAHRELIAQGVDPFERREEERQEARARALKAVSFGEVAAQWIETRLVEHKGKNSKALARALTRYAKPLALLPMASISSADIAAALKPLADRPAMRDKLVTTLHSVFDWAMAADIVPEALNPARRKKLGKLLPKRVSPVQHNRFLPTAELPAFMAKLAAIPGTVARAFEFLVHTGLRQAEVAALEWAFVDLPGRAITFPASVMKAGKAHRVHLSDQALAIIMSMLPLRRPGGCVFPGRSSKSLGGRTLRTFLERRFPELAGLQPHGTRSALKTWATATAHRREIIETALAHRVGDAVEAAYLNAEAPEIRAARVALYRDWSAFLTGQEPVAPAVNVVPLHAA